MKAVILELRGQYAAALSDDGSICRLKNRRYTVGQVIELGDGRPSSKSIWMRIACVAAIAVFLLIPCYAYYAPYTYVSLDVNPSISYTLNRYQRVLNVSGVNEDGAELIRSLDLKNRTMEEALSITLDALADQGYFHQNQWEDMIIAASCTDEEKSGEVVDSLAMTVQKTAQADDLLIHVDATVVCEDLVAKAKALGISPGKLSLIETLQEAVGEDQIQVEDWLDAPVKDIISKTKSLNEKDTSSAAQPNHQTAQDNPNTSNSGSKAQNQNSQNNGNNGKSDKDDNTGKNPNGLSQESNDKNSSGSKTAPGQSQQNGNKDNSGKNSADHPSNGKSASSGGGHGSGKPS